jgi:glucose-1-phosphate thymidylyltransferase
MMAVVLARGEGRRMRAPAGEATLTAAQAEAAARGHKGLMPVGSQQRPFLDYVLSALADAGCTMVCLVVAPRHDELRRRYLREVMPRRLAVGFAVQEHADGTARAVLAAAPFVGERPFLVLNSDNLYPVAAVHALIHADGPGVAAFRRDALVASSNIPASRITAFALLEVGADGLVRRIVEKPGEAEVATAGADVPVSMNLWRLDASVLDALRDVPRSTRGEYELPQAMQLAVSRGVPLRAVPAEGAVLDLSGRADVAEVGRRLEGIGVRL